MRIPETRSWFSNPNINLFPALCNQLEVQITDGNKTNSLSTPTFY